MNTRSNLHRKWLRAVLFQRSLNVAETVHASHTSLMRVCNIQVAKSWDQVELDEDIEELEKLMGELQEFESGRRLEDALENTQQSDDAMAQEQELDDKLDEERTFDGMMEEMGLAEREDMTAEDKEIAMWLDKNQADREKEEMKTWERELTEEEEAMEEEDLDDDDDIFDEERGNVGKLYNDLNGAISAAQIALNH